MTHKNRGKYQQKSRARTLCPECLTNDIDTYRHGFHYCRKCGADFIAADSEKDLTSS